MHHAVTKLHFLPHISRKMHSKAELLSSNSHFKHKCFTYWRNFDLLPHITRKMHSNTELYSSKCHLALKCITYCGTSTLPTKAPERWILRLSLSLLIVIWHSNASHYMETSTLYLIYPEGCIIWITLCLVRFVLHSNLIQILRNFNLSLVSHEEALYNCSVSSKSDFRLRSITFWRYFNSLLKITRRMYIKLDSVFSKIICFFNKSLYTQIYYNWRSSTCSLISTERCILSRPFVFSKSFYIQLHHILTELLLFVSFTQKISSNTDFVSSKHHFGLKSLIYSQNFISVLHVCWRMHAMTNIESSKSHQTLYMQLIHKKLLMFTPHIAWECIL